MDNLHRNLGEEKKMLIIVLNLSFALTEGIIFAIYTNISIRENKLEISILLVSRKRYLEAGGTAVESSRLKILLRLAHMITPFFSLLLYSTT